MERNNNGIINEIMTGKNASCMIVSPFDGEHVGFLNDLENNYQKTIWLHYAYEREYTLIYALLKKFLPEGADMSVARSYLAVSIDKKDQNVPARYLLDCVENTKTNNLFIISGLDEINETEKRQLIYMLMHCPDNLKIVLVSDSVLDLPYTELSNVPPSVFTEEDICKDTSRYRTDNPLTSDERKLLYALSEKKYVACEYARFLYGARLERLPRYIAHQYRSFVFRAGDIYVFNPSLHELLSGETKEIITADDFERRQAQYWLDKRRYVTAFDVAIDIDAYDIAEKSIGAIFGSDELLLDFYDYLVRNGKKITIDMPREYRCLTLLREILSAVVRADAEEFPTPPWDDDAPVRENVIPAYFYARFLEKYDRKAELKAYIESVFERGMTYGVAFYSECAILLRYYLMTENDLPSEDIRTYCKEENRSISWIAIRQAYAIGYVQKGVFTEAMKQVEEIKAKLPLYIVPPVVFSAAFPAGVVDMARNWAKECVAAYDGFDDTCDDCLQAYIVLGIVDFYREKRTEAFASIDRVIACAKKGSEVFFRALCIKSFLLAEIGQAESALKTAEIYAYLYTDSPSLGRLYVAIAYCHRVLESIDKAIAFAEKAQEKLSKKSLFGVLAAAVKLSALIEEKRGNVAQETEKLLSRITRNGLGMTLVVLTKCFRPILEYAEGVGVEVEPAFYSFFREKAAYREQAQKNANGIKVIFFGNVTVTVGGDMIRWKTAKARELFLLYVLVGAEGVSRSELITNFWSDYTYDSAINNLKTTNSFIRKTLSSYGIPFALRYANLKYSLEVSFAENDYVLYEKLLVRADREKDLTKKTIYVAYLLRKFGEGFAPEIKNRFFQAKRTKIKEDVVGLTIRVIKELTTEGMLVEAKNFLTLLKRTLHTNEYNAVLAELEKLNK